MKLLLSILLKMPSYLISMTLHKREGHTREIREQLDMGFQQCGMCDQQRLRPACTYAQSDQSLCFSLAYSMDVQLLTEHHLEFLSLKGGCTGSSESTLVKMPHCWKSHVTALYRTIKQCYFKILVYLCSIPWSKTPKEGSCFLRQNLDIDEKELCTCTCIY